MCPRTCCFRQISCFRHCGIPASPASAPLRCTLAHLPTCPNQEICPEQVDPPENVLLPADLLFSATSHPAVVSIHSTPSPLRHVTPCPLAQTRRFAQNRMLRPKRPVFGRSPIFSTAVERAVLFSEHVQFWERDPDEKRTHPWATARDCHSLVSRTWIRRHDHPADRTRGRGLSRHHDLPLTEQEPPRAGALPRRAARASCGG